ncbi:uncharacterized protein LOC135352414 isoform X2 [Halichondria panicea]|uniref:uncharacterized protein LOC135352414 isoform X2 n=1 Tax=Halichondria panicea TaxID=6063 RepID=UPI00312B5D9D
MDIASKVIMLILMQSVITAVATGCTCSSATNCPAPYAKLQTIPSNQSVRFELYNQSKYINETLRWCISGRTATNDVIFRDTFTERGTNLTYNNPYPDDLADGFTLYLVDGDCAQPLGAILINSLDGNFTGPQYYILLHVDKESPRPTIGPSTTTQSICYTSTISTTTDRLTHTLVDATKCIQTSTPSIDMGGASTTETTMAPDLSSTPTLTPNTSSVHQMETAYITSLSVSNTHTYPLPTSTPTVLGRREPIPEVSLGVVLVIVLCLYALTTIILVLRIKLLRGNARQPQVDANGIVENAGSKEQETKLS